MDDGLLSTSEEQFLVGVRLQQISDITLESLLELLVIEFLKVDDGSQRPPVKVIIATDVLAEAVVGVFSRAEDVVAETANIICKVERKLKTDFST